MRRYDDPVHVRRGLVQQVEAPEQFVWRDRLWQVCAVVSHWVETGPWWEHRVAAALLGADDEQRADEQGADERGRAGPPEHTGEEAAGSGAGGPAPVGGSLLAEREVWRVDATRGRLGLSADAASGLRGTFDLTYDTDTGQWRLTRCLD